MADSGTRTARTAGGCARAVARAVTVFLPLLLAYALVFQVVLASGLMAARAAGTFDPSSLCLNAPGDTDGGADRHGPDASIVHCPLCLSRTDAVLLPPPPPSPVVERLAVILFFEVGAPRPVQRPADRPPYRPRDPPAHAA